MEEDKVTVSVTPPTLGDAFDHGRLRAWMEGVATGQGYVDLEWREETDLHGMPMGRLLGRRARGDHG
jgi:hypothetical protein